VISKMLLKEQILRMQAEAKLPEPKISPVAAQIGNVLRSPSVRY